MMFAALVLSIVTPVLATPSPAPSGGYGSYGSLPVIIRVSTNAVCSTLRQTVIPVGYIAKTNDNAFTDVKARTLKVAMSRIADDQDFELLARHDQVDTGDVLSNISLAIGLIDQSRKKYPDQKKPEIEAMRAELERVLDLQRKYNSVVDNIAGSYLDSLSQQATLRRFLLEPITQTSNSEIWKPRRRSSTRTAYCWARALRCGTDRGYGSASQQADRSRKRARTRFPNPPIKRRPGAHDQLGLNQISSELQGAEDRLQTTAIAALRLCKGGSKASPSPKP